MSSLIDSHCHIDFPQFEPDRQSILSACRQRGMSAILVPGVSRSQWSRMAQMITQYDDLTLYPRLLPAYGLHPYFIEEHDHAHLVGLEERLAEGAVAVGEIGLDAFNGDDTLDAQMDLFCAQLNIAKNHSLPIVVHSRKTQDLILKQVRQLRFEHGGIMHAFSGSLQQAQKAVDLGFKIGFGGAATYDRATRLRGILKALPRDAIVFETDAPDIPPSFDRNNRNSPLNLFRIIEILADVRQESVDDLLEYSSQNLAKLLEFTN